MGSARQKNIWLWIPCPMRWITTIHPSRMAQAKLVARTNGQGNAMPTGTMWDKQCAMSIVRTFRLRQVRLIETTSIYRIS